MVRVQRPFIAERFEAVLSAGRQAVVALPDEQRRPGLGADPTLPAPIPGSGLLRWATTLAEKGGESGFTEFSQEEADLYVAAMGEDAETVGAAWERWRAAVDLDTLPYDQHRLLPKLHANLARHGIAGEADPRIGGVYRRTWCQNQQVVWSVRSVLVFVSGSRAACWPAWRCGRGLSCYRSLGERPLSQVDLLVYQTCVDAGYEILRDAGWRLDRPACLLANTHYQYWVSQAVYHRTRLPPLVVRWRVLPDAPPAGFEARFIELAFEAPATSSQKGMSSYEVQLALAGADAATERPSRLVSAADVGLILQQHKDIHWEQVCELAHLLRGARPLHSSLLAVSRLLDLPLPREMLTELA